MKLEKNNIVEGQLYRMNCHYQNLRKDDIVRVMKVDFHTADDNLVLIKKLTGNYSCLLFWHRLEKI